MSLVNCGGSAGDSSPIGSVSTVAGDEIMESSGTEVKGRQHLL